ncbi:PREDICTED: UPF0481 protein At3g47200-like [Populus euphratica]|uniref:UPF0481 protein At3g47200-like n=1 Tax=Populus euphratica TaxID=75702 RepID=A0AAJ6V0W9_POPEU|nr:PREDICTED: UPF0481 protein At3g47200-like [Populus euphratica]
MGEIRSPYFSLGQNYSGDNSDHIHSPYISYGGEDYHGDYAEIHPPYSSAGDYLADNADIHSEALFHQHISGNSNNAQQFVGHGKVPFHVGATSNDEPENDVCIYRVGEALRKSNEAMYSPQKISIGPIHHGNKNLRSMEKKKSEYYKIFWEDRVSKAGELNGAQGLFWDALQADENEIRQCYEVGSHEIENSRDFLRMIMYDAVFIFELFLKHSEDSSFQEDSKLKESWLRAAIRRDLILLENQLPFFILEKLYKLLPENVKGQHTEFKTLACIYFKHDLQSNVPPADTKAAHFTDLVRSLLSVTRKDKSVDQIKSFHSATKLRQAGVNFKRRPDRESECLLHVDFSRGLRTEFLIPKLKIRGHTESLFRNLVALEKRVYPGQEYICHYINLLSILVVKPKDAKLLMKNDIVTSYKDEVAVRDLISSLGSSANDIHSCFQGILSAVDEYYKSSWTKNPAYFIEEFFGNLWKGVGTVTAAILLILTLVQTTCSLLDLR